MSGWPAVDFGHTGYRRRLRRGDVYGVGPDPARAGKRPLQRSPSPAAAASRRRNGSRRSAGCRPIGEPVTIAGVADPTAAARGQGRARSPAPGLRRRSARLLDASAARSPARAHRRRRPCRGWRARRSTPASRAWSRSRWRRSSPRRVGLVRLRRGKRRAARGGRQQALLAALCAGARRSSTKARLKSRADRLHAASSRSATPMSTCSRAAPCISSTWCSGSWGRSRGCTPAASIAARPARKRGRLPRLRLRRDRHDHDQRGGAELQAVGAGRDLRAERLPRRRGPVRD